MIEEIQIEITNRCNSNCKMCLKRKDQRKPGVMDFDFFCVLIDQAKRLGCKTLKANWFGESFLASNLYDYLTYAKNKKFRVFGFTNGSVLKIPVLSLYDKLFFSVDDVGWRYNKIRRGLKFDQVAENIREYIGMKKTFGLETELIIVCLDMDNGNVDRVNKAFGNVIPVVPAPLIKNRYKKVKKKENVTCKHNVRSRLVVAYDGRVYLCCQDWLGKHQIGNLCNQKMEDIINGDARRYYLENLNSLDICQNCM